MKNHGLTGSTLLDAVGFCIIVELQGILHEFGSDFINNIIDIFHESSKTRKVEPWWEQIKGNEYPSGQIGDIINLFNKSRMEE